jgi:hypothetical protein
LEATCADRAEAVDNLKPWLKEVNTQTSIEKCLLLANMAYQAVGYRDHEEEPEKVLWSLYQALAAKARDIDHMLYADAGADDRAKELYQELDLDHRVAVDVFGDRCTKEAIDFADNIDELMEARRSKLTDGETILHWVVKLFNKGGRGSFKNLRILYGGSEALGLDKQELVKALAERCNECLDFGDLLDLYYETWQDPELEDASQAFLKRLTEVGLN